MEGLRSNAEASADANVITQVNSLHNSTSEFDESDTIRLKITYKRLENIREFSELIYNQKIDARIESPLYIKNLEYDAFVGCCRNISKVHMLSNKEKQFAILVDQIALNEDVLRGTEESKTDTFVDYVLRETGLADYPLTLRLKPVYELRVRHKRISSIYDFSVEKENNILLVEEDKHIRNTTLGSAWGEYQIAGEILAGAYSNYVMHTISSQIITIRVIGTRFTFYHTVVPLEYLVSLDSGLPTSDISVFRYPNTDTGLDFKDTENRHVIIDMLLRIRQKLVSS